MGGTSGPVRTPDGQVESGRAFLAYRPLLSLTGWERLFSFRGTCICPLAVLASLTMVGKRKPKTLTRTIGVRVDEDLYERLEKCAARHQRTPGSIGRILIQAGIAEFEKRPA